MLLALLATTVSIAASITIAPGQSITVQGGSEPTVVSCSAPAAPAASSGIESFCYCKARSVENSTDFSLLKVVIQGTLRSETELKTYSIQKACDAAVKVFQACK